MKTIAGKYVAVPFGLILSGTVLFSAEDSPAAAGRSGTIVDLEPLHVIGSREQIEFLPGSAAFIDVEEIRSQNYDDIHKMVQRVPGVYFREEDGLGIFSNLSLRGANPNRSAKVTVMEDGVLTSPAPYAAPSAYYTPTAGRMHGIEILKGSSQVMYGPETTGGVINYLSTPIPLARAGYVRTTYGTDNEVRIHAHYGDVVETGFGNVGFLLEGFHRSNDGFKTIDERPGFNRGGDTGFTKNEPMLKLSWQPLTSTPQVLEFKIGYTELDFNETYLGLAEEDFARNPYRRYAATRFDNIVADQTRTYLRHTVEPTPDLRLTTTAYYNQFNRNWAKLQSVSTDPDGLGGFQNLSESLAGRDGGARLEVLRGDAEGSFRTRDNNREYASYGLENRTRYSFETGTLDHTLELGIRLHEDYEDRFQQEQTYRQNSQGAIVDSFPAGAPGHQDNRRSEARAIALFAQNRIGYDQWAVTPGIRYENIRYEVDNRRTGTRQSSSLDVFAPGIGLTYDYTPNLTFFTGLYRGISVPAPGDAVNNIKEERTVSYELGGRYNNHSGFRSELVFFYTDFSNMIVPENIGSGQTRTENVGEATVWGIEALVGFDPGVAYDWSFRNPNYVAFTWTDATLDNDTFSTNAESIFSGGRKGNRLPYIPRHLVSVGTGAEFERWGVYLDANYTPSTFATADNTSEQINPGNPAQGVDPFPDARFGKTESRVILDLSAHYRLTENARILAGIHNLLDEEYVASRLPHGPRPGAPLTGHIGLEVTF